MNNQKLFLVIAIVVSIFLLWNKWQIKHNSQSNQPSTVVENNTDVPIVIKEIKTENNKDVDVPTINGAVTHTTNLADITTITTDLLTLEVDNKGATIISALLNSYSKELNTVDKFQLLSDKEEDYLVYKSGLAPQQIMPTHLDNFTSNQSTYDMTEDNLVVSFFWHKNNVEVEKRFHFKRNSYLFDIDYLITNNTDKDITILSYSRFSRNEIDQHSMVMPTFSGGAIYNDEEVYQKFDFDEFSQGNTTTSKGGWIAMIEHYFVSALIPNQQQISKFNTKVYDDKYTVELTNPTVTVKSGERINLSGGSVYLGPKEKQRIEKIKGLDHSVDYSWLYIIAKPLSEILYWIFSVVGSWGLTIIILTILIKLVFYKLSEKSYKSMAGMRKLAPRLEQLKAAYGNDRQKMGQKTMELYREAKVNPASGCLPILAQMPVFIALYWVLIEMIELRHSSFLYLPDLSAKDPYFILPIIMGISMFVQQKLNPKPTDPMQAKIMMGLPIIFTVFFLWFPSGLVLYWVVNNILSIVQQWVINKRINS